MLTYFGALPAGRWFTPAGIRAFHADIVRSGLAMQILDPKTGQVIVIKPPVERPR